MRASQSDWLETRRACLKLPHSDLVAGSLCLSSTQSFIIGCGAAPPTPHIGASFRPALTRFAHNSQRSCAGHATVVRVSLMLGARLKNPCFSLIKSKSLALSCVILVAGGASAGAGTRAWRRKAVRETPPRAPVTVGVVRPNPDGWRRVQSLASVARDVYASPFFLPETSGK